MEYITPAQVADQLQLSPDRVYQLIRSKRLGHYRIGRLYRISEKQLQKYLESAELGA